MVSPIYDQLGIIEPNGTPGAGDGKCPSAPSQRAAINDAGATAENRTSNQPGSSRARAVLEHIDFGPGFDGHEPPLVSIGQVEPNAHAYDPDCSCFRCYKTWEASLRSAPSAVNNPFTQGRRRSPAARFLASWGIYAVACIIAAAFLYITRHASQDFHIGMVAAGAIASMFLFASVFRRP